MSSKPGSRLNKRPTTSDVSPILKSKIEALQGKYNEFVSNCSNLFQDPLNLKPSENNPKYSSRREQDSEQIKENLKLKRENTILAKTVEELSCKILNLESARETPMKKSEVKQPVRPLEVKKEEKVHIITQGVEKARKELEKARQDLEKVGKSVKEPEQQRSATPNVVLAGKKNYLKIAKSKAYSPVARNRSGSPISRSISPKDRATHNIKSELISLKTELEKTKEERNLYKVWKDYCSSHPPVPPGIHTIINHYETEISKLSAMNSIISTKLLTLAKSCKLLLRQLECKASMKSPDLYENLKLELNLKVADALSQDSNRKIDSVKSKDGNKFYSFRSERENIKKEGKISMRPAEDEFKAEFESMLNEKFYLGTTVKATENDRNQSSLSVKPYGRNMHFELSFASKEKFSLLETISSAVENSEKTLGHVLQSVNESIAVKVERIGSLKGKANQLKRVFDEKFRRLSMKLREKDEVILRMQLESDATKETLKLVERIKENERDISSLKASAKKNKHRKQNSLQFEESELESIKHQLKSKELLIDNLKEIVAKEKESSQKSLIMIIGYETEIEKITNALKHAEDTRVMLLLEKEKEIQGLKEALSSQENYIIRIKSDLEASNSLTSQKNEAEKLSSETLLKSKDQEILSLHRQLKDKEDDIELLKSHFHKSTSATQRNTASLEEISNLKIMCSSLSQENSSLTASLSEASRELAKKKSLLEASEDNSKILLEKLSRLKQDLKLLKSELSTTKSSLQSSETYSKDLRDSILLYQLKLSESESMQKQYESKIHSLTQQLQPSPNQPNLSSSSTIFSIIPSISYHSLLSQLIQKPLSPNLAENLTEALEAIHELTENNTYLKLAYQKLTEDVGLFKSAYKEKIEDLTLDKYELVKELEEAKKRWANDVGEWNKIKDELDRAEKGKRELMAVRTENELKLAKLMADFDTRGKEISQKDEEIESSKLMLSRVMKEKEQFERELQNMTKNITLDNSQARKEMASLQSQISSLEQMNLDLEKSKSQVEAKYKKAMNEKAALSEKLDDYLEEIESLKHTRKQQEQEIQTLSTSIASLSTSFDESQKSITIYKNKLATYMCNANALNQRSVSPQPLRLDDSISFEESDPNNTYFCKSFGNDNPSSPTDSIEILLAKLQRIAQDSVPEPIVNWCKQILGQENYVLRYPESTSNISDDSRSNIEQISVISEGNSQEMNYRVHAKLTQQQKAIESLQARVVAKKNKVKMYHEQVKVLQTEIKRLDGIIQNLSSFDAEYFKATIVKFVEKVKKIEKDGVVMLQILFAQLGITPESIQLKGGQLKWGLFKKS